MKNTIEIGILASNKMVLSAKSTIGRKEINVSIKQVSYIID